MTRARNDIFTVTFVINFAGMMSWYECQVILNLFAEMKDKSDFNFICIYRSTSISTQKEIIGGQRWGRSTN